MTPDNEEQAYLECFEFLHQRIEWELEFWRKAYDHRDYCNTVDEMYRRIRYFEAKGYNFEPADDWEAFEDRVENPLNIPLPARIR